MDETLNNSNEEMKKLKEKLEKSEKNVQRLKKHLLEIEENNTITLIEKEEKIQQLSKEIELLRPLENKCRHYDLETQLKEKILVAEKAQEALIKLQNILDSMQNEQETEVNSEIIFLRKRIEKSKEVKEELERNIKDLTDQLTQAKLEIEELKIQRNSDSKIMEILKKQNENREKTLNETLERLSKQIQNEDRMIEKSIVSKLILSYLDSSANKKDVLNLLSNMLGFSEEEKKRIGLISTSWFNFWGSKSNNNQNNNNGDNNNQNNNNGEKNRNKSIGDMWVEFILKEVEENAGNTKTEQVEESKIINL